MAEGDDLYKTERSAAKSGGVYRTGGADASDIYGEPSKGGKRKQAAKDRDDLSDAEEAGGQPDSQANDGADSSFYHPSTGHAGQTGRGYRPSRGVSPDRQGFRNAAKFMNRRKLLLFGGGSFLLILPIILFLAFLIPSLKIPQLAAEVEGYRLARISRTFYKNAAILTADKSAIDASTDVTTKELVGKTPLGKSLSLLKPARVINNMKSNDVLSFEYDDSGNLKKLVFKLNNGTSTEIEPPNYKYSLKPSDIKANYQERIRVATQTKAALNQVLDESNFLVRTKVARTIQSALGIHLLWWERAGLAFNGKNQAAADVLEAQLTEQQVNQIPSEDLRTATLQEQADQVQEAYKTCFENAACTEDAIVHNGVPTSVGKLIDNIHINTNSVLGIANPAYALAFPVCMVYDGSKELSSSFLNTQNAEAMHLFLGIAAADSQEKKGETTAGAVAALGRQAGNINASVPGQIARGNTNVDTSNEVSAQASSSGEFTIFNAFDRIFGGSGNSLGVQVANVFANNLCPIATNKTVAETMTAVNFALLLIPGSDVIVGSADSGAEGGALALAKTIGSSIVDKITSKVTFNAVRNTAIQVGTTDAATQGLTYFARMEVLAHSGMLINALDKTDFANNFDMAATAYGNQMMQQQQFGRPLTPDETTGVEKEDVGFLNQQNQAKDSYTRNFALSNPYSPAGKLAMSLSNVNINSVASFFGNLPHALASIFTPFASFFSHASAVAPANADYGMVQFGYSTAEEKLINDDASYDPIINAQILADSGQSVAIAHKYAKCFGYTADDNGNLTFDPNQQIGNLLSGQSPSIQRDDNGHVVANSGDCAPANLSFDSADHSFTDSESPDHPYDLIFRWRLNQAYQNTLGDLEGVQDPTGANTPTGGGNQAGLTNPFPGGWVPNRLDMGSDGTFSGQIVAPFAGTITYAADSFSNWGGYMEIKADQQPSGLPTSTLYFAEGLSPIVKSGHVDAGQPIANPAPSPYGNAYGTTSDGSGQIEWGVAADGASVTDPLAEASLGAGKCPAATTQSRSMVLAFSDWMQQVFGLGAPTATNDAGCA